MEADPSLSLAFGWCLLAGFLMSMGAGGGGILAGVGHITILGIQDANSVKVLNQLLELASRAVSLPIYHRQRRLLWGLAAIYSVGAPAGAIAGSWTSRLYVSNMESYRSLFGILVILVAIHLAYEARFKPARRPRSGPDSADPARTLSLGLRKAVMQYGEATHTVRPLTVAGGAFVIAFFGSMLGIGAGFLVTPFIATVLGFPMFLAMGTAQLALVIPVVASVATYVGLGVSIDWGLLAIEIPGIMIGSAIGPRVNRYMNEAILKGFVAAVLLGIGVYYLIL